METLSLALPDQDIEYLLILDGYIIQQEHDALEETEWAHSI